MSERYRVEYSMLARDDLKAIHRYIAYSLKEPQIASGITKRIRASIRSLDYMSERYVRVDWEPWHSMNVRHYSVGNYEIYYSVDNQNLLVTIIRIFYGGRDIKNITIHETDLP